MDPDAPDPQMGWLRWRCRRGMKELDRLLDHYREHDYGRASPGEQGTFRELLEMQDPLLYAYVLGRALPADPAQAALIRYIASLGRGLAEQR
ncbi:MAG: succinate dehydrogenase assembly factor 2 [Proteobacteria bacterium]|nr:succinate dehydrogenase assembly factor 2 [Pseudomonadota bacterium]